MEIVAVNVGMPRTVEIDGKSVATGIYKQAVIGRVWVRGTNLDGDGQADLSVHGGPNMAVYAYPHEHYATWQEELGREVFPSGWFGENLTTRGVLEDEVCLGDVFRVGEALLQVTQPRLPCFKLVHKMNEGPGFLKRFLRSLRLGWYFRVLEEGTVAAGDRIEVTERAKDSVNIRDFVEFSRIRPDVEVMRRAAAVPGLPEDWKEWLDNQVSKLEARS